MPDIRIQWNDAAQTTILAHYPPGWTWDDYHNILDRLVQLTGGRDAPVHFINVYEPGAHIPRTTAAPHHRRTVRDLKVGVTVYVTADPLVTHLTQPDEHRLRSALLPDDPRPPPRCGRITALGRSCS